jgi:2'-5' RNA ligase
MADNRVLRLFFALWPDDDLRRALHREGARLHAAWGGRRMHAGNLHMTLAFLGNVPEARLDAVCEAASTVGGEGFELGLDLARCWRHNLVGHLAASASPPALLALAKSLEEALRVRGFELERRPFAAHVTLLRDARCAEGAPDGAAMNPAVPLRWRARDFVLVESVRGEGYRVMRRWRLRETGSQASGAAA